MYDPSIMKVLELLGELKPRDLTLNKEVFTFLRQQEIAVRAYTMPYTNYLSTNRN